MAHLPDDPALGGLVDLLDAQSGLLLDAARGLDDDAVRAPSRLPGWSRGHVLTHLARNADALAGVLAAAELGRQAGMYPSWEVRDAEIEAGAGRPAAELLTDLATSTTTLGERFRSFPADRLDGLFTSPAGWWRPVRDSIWFRCREVVLHHVDLGTGFSLGDAPPLAPRLIAETADLFASRDAAPALDLVATDLDRSWQVRGGGLWVAGPATALAGWLTGRADGSGLTADQPLPPLPPWA